MRFRPLAAALAVCVLPHALSHSAHAALLFSEGFDYGGVTDNIDNVSPWTTSSGVIDYDHDGGLTHPQMAAEVGGAIHHDFTGGGSRNASLGLSLDPFPGTSPGDEFWLAGLIQINALTVTTGDEVGFRFDNSQTVNGWGFLVDSGLNVNLFVSDNDSAAGLNDTGIDITATGTYLLISRATIGAGPNSDKDSTIDFWFNPLDASSVGALGTPDFSTGPDSRFGRTTGSFNNLQAEFASQNERLDEIRFGETLFDVTQIPEPASLALLGLGCVLCLRRRRQ